MAKIKDFIVGVDPDGPAPDYTDHETLRYEKGPFQDHDHGGRNLQRFYRCKHQN